MMSFSPRQCSLSLLPGLLLVCALTLIFAEDHTEPANAARSRRCHMPLSPASWAQRVQATADTTSLAQAFRRQRYKPPSRSYLLGAQVVPGVGQPAFRYVSLGKGGFAPSPRRYWPASTIKLWAAVGALMRLKRRGLDGRAWLQLSDGAGTFAGRPAALYKKLDNVSYDRLLRIASLQQLNHIFRPQLQYRHLILRRGYGGTGRISRTPAIPFLQAAHRGTLPAQRFRPGKLPCRKNCTSLFEIQDVLRRVVFHHKLPSAQRLPITRSDAKRLRRSLRKQWKWIKDAVHRQLGKDARIFNKAGSVPGNHLLDNAVIASSQGHFLLTVASPWPRRETSVAPSLRRLNELARQALWQLQHTPGTPQALAQSDAGIALRVRLLRQSKRPLRFRVEVTHPPGKLDQLWLWLGRRAIELQPSGAGSWHSKPMPRPPRGAVLTIRGHHQGHPSAHRSLRVTRQRLRCR